MTEAELFLSLVDVDSLWICKVYAFQMFALGQVVCTSLRVSESMNFSLSLHHLVNLILINDVVLRQKWLHTNNEQMNQALIHKVLAFSTRL